MVEILFLTISAWLLVVVAGYAQFRMPAYSASARKVVMTRVVLIAAGLAFGLIWARNYPDDPYLALLAFLIGFGAVHIPAAVILLLRRGAGRTRSESRDAGDRYG